MTDIKVENLNNESKEDLKKTGIYTIEFKSNPTKYYVGCTQSTLGFIKRWRRHLNELKIGNHHSIKLQNAYSKYGIEDLVFKIIDIYPSELCSGNEQYWINMLNSYKNGYNSRAKAESNFSCKHTPENIKFFSERMKGNKNPNFGKKLSKELCKQKSEALGIAILQLDVNLNIINRFKSYKEATDFLNLSSGGICKAIQKGTNCGGFKWAKEDPNKGKKNTKDLNLTSKVIRKIHNTIIQLNLDTSFVKKHTSINDAAKEVCVDPSNINRAINKRNLICKNYLWIYEEDYNDNTLIDIKDLLLQRNLNIKNNMFKARNSQKKTRSILQYTLNSIFIKEWDSILNASQFLKINSSGISRTCSNIQKQAGGFIWKYK